MLPLVGRKYGEHTQTARQDGADTAHASIYGAFGAGADAFIEKWFDGLNGIYGEKTVDLAEEFKRLKIDSRLQRVIKSARNDAGEGFESAMTEIADHLLKLVYNDENIVQHLLSTEWGRAARSVLVNTIAGIFSGDTMFELGR